eukprot:scaffold342902_cov35-Attheya_sp.AAC.1
MSRRSARREKGAAHVPNTTPPDSEIQGPPCFCGQQLVNPKPRNLRQNSQCCVCAKTYNAHSSCSEYNVQKRHNGGETKIMKA